MKKTIIALAAFAFFAMPAFAQYWTTTSTYDPFREGDKHIGLSVGTGVYMGPSEAQIFGNNYGIYKDLSVKDMNRSILNPTIAFHYKRVLQNNRVDWGNSFLLAYSRWGGKVEGANTLGDTTFNAKYSYGELTISTSYYIMVPIGDKLHINAGIGLTIGVGLLSKATVEYSYGVSENSTGGPEFTDMLIGRINALVGVDYALSDSFTLTANLMAWPYDPFDLLNEHKGFRNIGDGLYVNDKLPFQLTVGFTYAL